MASTYTANLKIELITPGEQSGAWGATTNNNFTNSIEQAIVGQASVSFPSNADLTLTLTDQPASVAQNARSFFLAVTSAVSLTTTRTLTLPAINKTYLISNGTTGSQAISVARTGGGTTVTVPNGARVLVYAGSTGVAPQVTHVPALTVGSTAAATETVATTGSTQTLTNKTLASPVVTGVATVPVGAVGAPSVTFASDSNTGVYSPGADQVAISTGGVQRLRVSSAGLLINSSITVGNGAGSIASNIAIGDSLFYSNTTGTSNVAIGTGALAFNTTGDSNFAVGTNTLLANTTGSFNTGMGRSAAPDITTGSRNVGVGDGACSTVTTGSFNTCVGADTYVSAAAGTTQVVIGYNLTGKGDNTAFIGGTNGAYNEKNVTTWETTSDARIKKNIVDNDGGLALIEQVRVRNFEYRTPAEITELPKAAAIDKPGVQLGVIAQELQQVLPSCVTENSTGVLSVSTDPLVWYLISAVQELSARVKELESRE
jgi:hypothetical protein